MTRGERNNNPCNIRTSKIEWSGKIWPSQDADFEQFDTSLNGIRAGGKIVSNYYKLDGLSTVQEIISRWAPGIENDTNAYINFVAGRLGVATSECLDVLDPGVLGNLLTAIIYQENGECIYSTETIAQAVSEALA